MPNKKTVVQTNNTPGSIKEVPLKAVKFAELWANYPSGNPYDNPAYENQCAIRMSVTLHRVGIGMKSFSQKLIRPMNGDKIGRILLDGKPTATRADEMGQWLKLQPFAGLSKAEDVTGPDWEAKVKGRTGIIQFSRYWSRDGESAANASGGHIDLWNGRELTSPSIGGAINTFMRFTLGISSAWYSDLGKSRQILFWEIK
ncbi:Type VI secretion system amidase effector protein Tae4 [Paraburkholderia sacchari]|uniref:type VI secretion system amidase effector protein Tae4 n=1 Tax=Paraburkholderia sacchari TaxID=159450 RepID=UPI0039A75914